MINDRIRYPEVRVIDEAKEQMGVMRTREAVDLARERGQDLILVAAQAQPPVCRIMDYGKYKYEQSKSKKPAKKSELKMVRLHPRTGVHDRDILIRHAERFLREGNKVRVVCQFKGRENAYPELGRQQLDAVSQALAEVSTVEGAVTKQGRDMTMMLTPRPGVKPLPKLSKAERLAQELEEQRFAATQQEMGEDQDGESQGSDDQDSKAPEAQASEAEALDQDEDADLEGDLEDEDAEDEDVDDDINEDEPGQDSDVTAT